MNATRSCRLLLGVLGLTLCISSLATAQGYYQRNVQRNPITGRLEIVPAPNGYGRFIGPMRGDRDFYGARFNPYNGTATQSRVQRNPVTGRMYVQNEFYNPWTGARVGSTTRFNPFTGRYETVQTVTPPHRLPAEVEMVEPMPDSADNSTTSSKPRVIETSPPPSLNPPDVVEEETP